MTREIVPPVFDWVTARMKCSAVSITEIAGRCVEIEREVSELADDLEEAKKAHSDAKKAYDAKIVTMRLAVERLGRVIVVSRSQRTCHTATGRRRGR